MIPFSQLSLEVQIQVRTLPWLPAKHRFYQLLKVSMKFNVSDCLVAVCIKLGTKFMMFRYFAAFSKFVHCFDLHFHGF